MTNSGDSVESEEKPALGRDLRLLELIVDNIDDLIAVIDSQGKRVWNNAAYARVLGYTVESLIGSNSLIEVHPDDLPKVQLALRDSMQTGSGRRIEYRLRHRAGHYVYLESQGWVLPASENRKQLLVVISRDISQRKDLEARQASLYEQQSRQAKAMAAIVHSVDFQRSDVEHGSEIVLYFLCKTLQAEWAELWRLGNVEEEGQFFCLRSFQPDEVDRRRTSEASLESPGLPALLRGNRVIALPDDFADTGDLEAGKALLFGGGARPTQDQINAKLVPGGARGLLAAVWLCGKPAGFLLIATNNSSREWSIYERNFCAALADLVSMLLEGRQRLDTLQALQLSQKMISAQLADASSYVRSQLPVNLCDSVQTDWRYLPSSALGGDALDFFWLNEDHLVIFLLDVVGHGVGSALLATSILHLLRQRALKDGDPLDPVSVLVALNRSFQMDEHGDKVFSIWYGVFDRISGTIRFAAAGHPPAVLVSRNKDGEPEVTWLRGKGLWIGAAARETYEGGSAIVAQDAELFVFSDGLYELSTPAGPMIGLEGFGRILVDLYRSGTVDLEKVLSEASRIHGLDQFEDDASILKVRFG
ncbi:MAG: SpoIIE family protein phosphatase [Verrucomicrobia bacterium]|nr:SpoIIE family protein phosphatase [Verrucomicrobiota bacterium]